MLTDDELEQLAEAVANKLDYDELASVLADDFRWTAIDAVDNAISDYEFEDIEPLKQQLADLQTQVNNMDFFKADRHHQHKE